MAREASFPRRTASFQRAGDRSIAPRKLAVHRAPRISVERRGPRHHRSFHPSRDRKIVLTGASSPPPSACRGAAVAYRGAVEASAGRASGAAPRRKPAAWQGSGIPAGGGLPWRDRSFRRFRDRDGLATAASGPPGQADLQRGKPLSTRRKVPARRGTGPRRGVGFRYNRVVVSAPAEADGGAAWAGVEREPGTAPRWGAQLRQCSADLPRGERTVSRWELPRSTAWIREGSAGQKKGACRSTPPRQSYQATRFQGSQSGTREPGAWRWNRPAASPAVAAPAPGSPGSASPWCGRGTAAGRTRRASPTGCRSAA